MWTISFIVIVTLASSSYGDTVGDVLTYSVTEESPPNTLIGNVAVDADLVSIDGGAILQDIQFGLMSQHDSSTGDFTIDESNGILRTANRIDRDVMCPSLEICHVTIDVAIVKPIRYFRVIRVRIEILDINDNDPEFPQPEITIRFSESAALGKSVGLPFAFDIDCPTFGVTQYEMRPRSEEFELKVTRVGNDQQPSGLELVLTSELDRERLDVYQVVVWAFDGGSPSRSGELVINVIVDDANDHSPQFDSHSYSVSVYEDIEVNETVYRMVAHDADAGANGRMFYSFSARTVAVDGELFGIVRATGNVYLKSGVDYERTSLYELEVVAHDGGFDSESASALLTVNILDVNDNTPQITVSTLTESDVAEISESAPVETFVAHVSVFDADAGLNGKTVCTVSHPTFQLRNLSEKRYKVVTSGTLDRESVETYSVKIECRDLGLPGLHGVHDLTVKVTDENDNSPIFSQTTYRVTIPENNVIGAFILQMNASDDDIGANGRLRYSLRKGTVSRFVHIDTHTGIIRATARLNYEAMKRFHFEVVARDNGTEAKSATASVIITVQDVNDESPRFVKLNYEFYVSENLPPNTTVGRINATDLDSPMYSRHTFSMISEGVNYASGNAFSVKPLTGEITTRLQFDREFQSLYYFKVIASDTDSPSLSSSASVTVYVTDTNDNVPVILYPLKTNNSVTISSHVPVGHAIFRVQAIDADIDENANLTYRIFSSDDAFSIQPISGVIVTTRKLDEIDYKKYNLIIAVTDNGASPKRATVNLEIIVNASFPFTENYTQNNDTSTGRRQNLIIIIAVATTSGIVMAILILAIVILKRNDGAAKAGIARKAWRKSLTRENGVNYTLSFRGNEGRTAKDTSNQVGVISTFACSFQIEFYKVLEEIFYFAEL